MWFPPNWPNVFRGISYQTQQRQSAYTSSKIRYYNKNALPWKVPWQFDIRMILESPPLPISFSLHPSLIVWARSQWNKPINLENNWKGAVLLEPRAIWVSEMVSLNFNPHQSIRVDTITIYTSLSGWKLLKEDNLQGEQKGLWGDYQSFSPALACFRGPWFCGPQCNPLYVSCLYDPKILQTN